MISIELWRAKIGLFNCSSRSRSSSLSTKCSRSLLVSHLTQSSTASLRSAGCLSLTLLLVVAVTVQLLLSAGDVEQNPGPLNRDAKPVVKDLMYMSYIGEDGRKVTFRLMDRVKPQVARLAIALGFPQHIIDGVETKCDPVLYLLSSLWLKGGNLEHDSRPLTWETLITALEEAGLMEEAEILDEHFVAAPPSDITDLGMGRSGTPDIIDHPEGGYSIEHGPVKVFVKPDVPESLLSLMRSYADMLLVLRTTELPQDKFRCLKYYLSDFCDEKSIRHCYSVCDIVDHLKEHLKIYMFNIDTLNVSCKHFCSSDVTGCVQQYRQELDDFLSDTSVNEFKGTLETQITDSSKVESVTLKLDEIRAENTLKALKNLVFHFLGNTQKTLIHCKTRSGCVCVTWIVPTSMVPILREKAELLSPEHLASKGVLELVIGLRIAPNEAVIAHDMDWAPFDTIDHEYNNVMREEHQNVMMIATMQRRHEHELAAVRKDVSVYEERCDKLEEERDEAKLQKTDVESNLEILQQKYQQLERNQDMAKRSAQAVISDLENKLHSALERTHQEQLVTEKEAEKLAIKLQSTSDSQICGIRLEIVVDELKEIAGDWKQLGSHLLSPHLVKEIDLYVQPEENPLKCLELVISNWKDLYPDGTWSDIFTSLVKMGKTELSHILQEKYLNRPKVPEKKDAATMTMHLTHDLLVLELKEVRKWDVLGIYLGLEESEITEIERDHHSNARRRIAMLEKWMEKDVNASWEKVIDALESISRIRLAYRLKKKYCTSESNPPDTKPAESSFEKELIVDRQELIVDEIEELEEKYLLLVTNVHSTMSEANPSLMKLQMFSRHYTKTKVTTIEELFDSLEPFCFLEYALLEKIVKYFLSRDTVADDLRDYLQQLDKFKASTTLKQFMESIEQAQQSHSTTSERPGLCTVRLCLVGGWLEKTIDDLEKLVNEIFKEKRDVLAHLKIVRG